jgi:N6-adenosine-specific RNA methylase IME4
MEKKYQIELFAREKTEGWDVFGNEVEGSISLSPHSALIVNSL